LYPFIFGAAGVFVLTKEVLLRDKLSLAISLLVALITLFVADAIKTTLFLPMLDLLEKLS